MRLRPAELIVPLVGLLLSFVLDYLQEKQGEEKAIFGFSRAVQSVCIAFGIMCVLLSILWSSVPTAAFVYQGF